MSKVLVIDRPKNCLNCPMRYDYKESDICALADDIIYNCSSKPDWCPLLPLPEKKDITKYIQRGDAKSMTHLVQYMYAQGWNDCIDYILKEKTNEN